MSIIDVPQPNWTEIQQRVLQIRKLLSSVVGHAEGSLHSIRNIVRGNRPAIVSEIGSDAAALLTVYTKLKEAIEAAKEITVEDLPN